MEKIKGLISRIGRIGQPIAEERRNHQLDPKIQQHLQRIDWKTPNLNKENVSRDEIYGRVIFELLRQRTQSVLSGEKTGLVQVAEAEIKDPDTDTSRQMDWLIDFNSFDSVLEFTTEVRRIGSMLEHDEKHQPIYEHVQGVILRNWKRRHPKNE